MRILLAFCLLVSIAVRADVLEGQARLTWSHGRHQMTFDQVVKVGPCDTCLELDTLDDFGNSIFEISFRPNFSVSGTKISLPITQQEFISIIRFEVPEDFKATRDEKGNLRSITKKRLKIVFLNPQKIDRVLCPQAIEIWYKKTKLTLTWINLSISGS